MVRVRPEKLMSTKSDQYLLGAFRANLSFECGKVLGFITRVMKNEKK